METLTVASQVFDFQIKNHVLFAGWSNSVSVESPQFMESIKHLFYVAAEYNITRILIDSGTPSGGALTEDLVNLVQKYLPTVQPERIALLESPDFHWDNNLFQVLKYLKTALNMSFEIRSFSTRSLAQEWLYSL
ncbi:MAG TPA: hypothetical protein VK927_01140 [Adhaeribacter sp.]|nr:hypothetical protein [Adhaeribacter sp.]